MNERALIDRILEAALTAGAQTRGGAVVVGPGDDAAVLRPEPGFDLVWTSDDQVQGVHFDWTWCSWESAGRKAVGAALSDLAAMGATPQAALLSLCLPEGTSSADVEALARGVGAKLALAACPLAGGNVSRGPVLQLSVTAIGAVPRGSALRRSTGQAGDALYVSHSVGWARLGLLHLQAGGDAGDARWSHAIRHLLDPEPRLELGRALRERAERITCMDLSDGLARDLPRLARASGLAARVDSASLPAPDAALASEQREAPLALAWVGGEDYELLVAGPAGLEASLPLTQIGLLEPGEPGSVALSGPLAGFDAEGFDHLA